MNATAGRWAITAALAAGTFSAARQVRGDETIRPCPPGTAAHTDAGKALEALDADIRKLAPGANPAQLEKRIEALGEQACFRLAGDLSVAAKSGLALRTWWEDGGHDVATGALELGGGEPYVWVAPDVRRALTRETAPGHRLAPLLCPAYDETCGRDTDGWRLRAETALARAAQARRLQGDGFRPVLADWKRERPPAADDCPAYARKAPRHRRLTVYRQCLDAAAERAPTLAIGRIQKPTDGWLIVSGRRGHYEFCDELRAFDLATGSAYRVGSCSGLSLTSGGGVDHRATDAARKNDRARGTVSIDEIREAAWMLLQLGELDESVLTSGFGQALPKSIPAESDGGNSMLGLSSRSFSATSAQTSLHWRVATAARELGRGRITWPRDLNDDAEAYAAELLEVAEASFKPGCPPGPPPAAQDNLENLSAHRLDADSDSLDHAASSLRKAWRDLARDGCPTAKARAPR